jgi:predicted porin
MQFAAKVGLPCLMWGIYVKSFFISAAALAALAAAAHADELSDIQAQSRQLREQNAAMTKRLADLEKRQKTLEAAKPVAINPVDAMAADLPYKAAVKAKPPEDDDICVKGICVYGNFDMGLQYEQHGAPFGPLSGTPNNDALITKNGLGSYFGVGANQISSSFIGLRGKQEIADNLYAVFNLQTIFNPASGQNANGQASVALNNGLTTNLALQNAFADSSKSGQLFNNAAYFGLSSQTYGTFTLGRQSALSSDLVVNYDPVSGSNAWSLITGQGTNAGGGDTENRIWDNSYEYRLNIGPVRLAAEAQLRNGGNSAPGNAFEGNVGFDYQGLSVDFVGGKIFDAVSVTPLSVAQVQAATAGGLAIGGGQVAGTVSDNVVFQIAARYTIGPWRLFGGYEHIDFANPNNPLVAGAFDSGNFVIAAPNNTNFPSDKILQTVWVGARYAVTPNLDIAAGYYHEWQNTFATSAATLAGCAANGVSSSQCAGTEDLVSLVVDWRFARHVDLYAGVAYSQVNNGLANGFLSAATNNAGVTNPLGRNKASTYDPGVGLRYQF